MKNPTRRELARVKIPAGARDALSDIRRFPIDPKYAHSLEESIQTLVWQRDQAVALLRRLLDPNDCSLDHHGNCQEHRLETDCTQKALKEFLK